MKRKRRLFVLGGVAVVAAGIVAAAALAGGDGTGFGDEAESPAALASGAEGEERTDDALSRVLGQESGGIRDASPGGSSPAAAPMPPMTGAPPGSAAAYAAPGTGTNGGGIPSQTTELDRKIVFNATISLQVTDIPAAFGIASSVARQNGGFVERSTFANSRDGENERGSASLTIRVPADRYQDALQSLRTIEGAKVASEGSKSTEVTEQYVDLASRMRNLERTEGQYLELLAKATTIQDILMVNDRLDSVRSQIEQIKGRLNVLDRLTEMAAIDVSLTPLGAGKAEVKGSGPRGFQAAFADAWDASVEGLRYAGSAAGVAAVAAIWLVIPVAIIVAGGRLVRRRHGTTAAS